MLVQRTASLLLMFASAAALPAGETTKPVTVKDGDRIIFLGDSLTYLGGKEEPKKHVTKGYVRIVKETLQKKHKDIEVDWASTGGGTVQTLLSLLDKNVLPKKPTIVVIQIGCNDARGSTKEKFESGSQSLNSSTACTRRRSR